MIEQVHAAGGPGPLAASIDQWRERITARGRAMLTGSARLADYLSFLELAHGDAAEGHAPPTHRQPPVAAEGREEIY